MITCLLMNGKPKLPVEAVIFDLGRVLVGVDLSRPLWARIMGGLDGENGTGHGDQWQEVYRAYATGRLPPQQFYVQLRQFLGESFSYDVFVEQWCDAFYVMDGSEDLLRRVLAKVPVGLLSDTDPLHWARLRKRFGWLDLIAKPTLSFEIGYLKPDPHCYAMAAANLGLAPDACFFVDDLLANVEGARAAGMDAERFVDLDTLRAQLRQRALPD